MGSERVKRKLWSGGVTGVLGGDGFDDGVGAGALGGDGWDDNLGGGDGGDGARMGEGNFS